MIRFGVATGSSESLSEDVSFEDNELKESETGKNVDVGA